MLLAREGRITNFSLIPLSPHTLLSITFFGKGSEARLFSFSTSATFLSSALISSYPRSTISLFIVSTNVGSRIGLKWSCFTSSSIWSSASCILGITQVSLILMFSFPPPNLSLSSAIYWAILAALFFKERSDKWERLFWITASSFIKISVNAAVSAFWSWGRRVVTRSVARDSKVGM